MKSKLLGLAVVFALSGCATVKVAHPRADNVKKVAIVAYTGDVDLRTQDEKNGKGGGIGGMINGIKGATELGSGELKKTRTEEAEKGYQLLAKKLTEGAGFEVLDKDQLAKAEAYSKRLSESPNDGLLTVGLQTMPNVLREEVAQGMTPAERAELLKALGVDAIAMVHVSYVLGDTSGFSMGGMGKITKYPKAVVKIAMFDSQGEDPVWKDIHAEGEPTKDGLAETMGVNTDEGEAPLLVSAADSAYNKLIERYKSAK